MLDRGNSGTGVRLIMGAVATTDITAFFTGDACLRGRPMGRVIDPLRAFGRARSSRREGGRLPLTLTGAGDPMPIALPPAGAVGAGEIGGAAGRPERAGRDEVIEPEATRDHTERMLRRLRRRGARDRGRARRPAHHR